VPQLRFEHGLQLTARTDSKTSSGKGTRKRALAALPLAKASAEALALDPLPFGGWTAADLGHLRTQPRRMSAQILLE
jgi:hypothetical protein